MTGNVFTYAYSLRRPSLPANPINDLESATHPMATPSLRNKKNYNDARCNSQILNSCLQLPLQVSVIAWSVVQYVCSFLHPYMRVKFIRVHISTSHKSHVCSMKRKQKLTQTNDVIRETSGNDTTLESEFFPSVFSSYSHFFSFVKNYVV